MPRGILAGLAVPFAIVFVSAASQSSLRRSSTNSESQRELEAGIIFAESKSYELPVGLSVTIAAQQPSTTYFLATIKITFVQATYAACGVSIREEHFKLRAK